jgi:hypothetical protein
MFGVDGRREPTHALFSKGIPHQLHDAKPTRAGPLGRMGMGGSADLFALVRSGSCLSDGGTRRQISTAGWGGRLSKHRGKTRPTHCNGVDAGGTHSLGWEALLRATVLSALHHVEVGTKHLMRVLGVGGVTRCRLEVSMSHHTPGVLALPATKARVAYQNLFHGCARVPICHVRLAPSWLASAAGRLSK